MSPTVLRIRGYRFYFFSREELRAHIHVQHVEGEATVLVVRPGSRMVLEHGLLVDGKGEKEIRDMKVEYFGHLVRHCASPAFYRL